MSPERERARLLAMAIDRATAELREPITRVEVRADKVVCAAGPRLLTMSYGFAEALDASGAVVPGSGSWWVEVDGEGAPAQPDVARALGRMAGRWLRRRGMMP